MLASGVISTERSEWRDLRTTMVPRSLDFARDDKILENFVATDETEFPLGQ